MSRFPKARSSRTIPAEIAVLLGQPPLWRGESPEQFDAILLEVATSVGAKDAVDWFSARDIAYHISELVRFRGLQAGIIQNAQAAIIEELLKTTFDEKCPAEDVTYYISGARNDARRWATDLTFAKTIDERLAARGHDRNSIQAKAYLLCAAEMQALDKAIAQAELRRMTTLREIYRRDEYLARRLEQVSQQMIEGEFSEAAE